MSNETTLPTETEKTKRTRTSPRVKFADEVIRMMSDHMSDLQEELKEVPTNNNAKRGGMLAQTELLSDLMLKVKTMSDEGVVKPNYEGRHYISQNADGTYTAFDSNVPPTVRTHGAGTKHNYAKVWGPFRTEGGVEYRLAHLETLAEYTPVF